MKSRFLSLVVFLLVIAAVLYGLLQLSKSRTFQFFGGITQRVQTDQKVIALTFDDAPSQYSDDVVRVLYVKGIHATFYVVGKGIEDYPDEMKNIVAMGNELGNHSYSHQRFLFKSLSFTESEIQKTNALIRNTGYTGPITFRPPYGKKFLILPWYLHEHGIETVMCDVEPDTYVPGNVDEIIRYTVEHTKPGSIILLHPFCETACEADREALPHIIDVLKEKGYAFVTVSELLKFQKK